MHMDLIINIHKSIGYVKIENIIILGFLCLFYEIVVLILLYGYVLSYCMTL